MKTLLAFDLIKMRNPVVDYIHPMVNEGTTNLFCHVECYGKQEDYARLLKLEFLNYEMSGEIRMATINQSKSQQHLG